MSPKKIAAANSILFFIFWLLVLYAGADHPPPPGFLLLIVLDAACAGLVYWRIPAYIRWHAEGKSRRWLYVFRDGLLAGVCAGLFMVVFSAVQRVWVPDSGPTPEPLDLLIWLAVLGSLGVLNAVFLYGVNALVAGRSERDLRDLRQTPEV